MAVDVSKTFSQWASDLFGVRTCTELPANLDDVVPVIQFTELGGLSPRFADQPRLDMDVYAATYGDAMTLALRLLDALMALRGPVADAAVVRQVRIDSRPARRPYENPRLRRVGLTSTVFLRPTSFA